MSYEAVVIRLDFVEALFFPLPLGEGTGEGERETLIPTFSHGEKEYSLTQKVQEKDNYEKNIDAVRNFVCGHIFKFTLGTCG